MSAPINQPWPETAIGAERALARAPGRVRMLFGLGPPRATAQAEGRTERLLAYLGPELQAIRWGEQVHGRLVASLAPESDRPFVGVACVGRCDALITPESGLGLLVWSADCVPVLLSGGGVVAAVHSGWRGTVADVVGAVVNRFRSEFGVAAESIEAALGPSISGPRYEVSQQVIDALSEKDIDPELWREGRRVDLRAFLEGRLQQLGLSAPSITRIGGCTADSRELASYRRDGAEAGRQWSLIYLTR
jgi:YfiH family protein